MVAMPSPHFTATLHSTLALATRLFLRPFASRMPTTFDDLPLDLLEVILEPLQKRTDLRRCLLVSREWRRVSERLLYGSIRLWGKDLS